MRPRVGQWPLQAARAARYPDLLFRRRWHGDEVLPGIDVNVLFHAVLPIVKLAVPSAELHQFMVRATLDYGAGLKHEDLIGAFDRGESMRDDEGRAAATQAAQPVTDHRLAFA